jgi:hypothetical protein
MAYCTIAEVAEALHTRVTPTNTALLQSCVDAAAEEIDAALDRLPGDDIAPTPDSPALVNRDNVLRAVQWYKANDVAVGGGGYAEVGLLNAPTKSFEPMSRIPFKQQWGVA